jgi:hypothetical protein
LEKIATIKGVLSPVMNFALERSGIPLLREIRIQNKTGDKLTDLSLSVISSSPFVLGKTFRIEQILSHGSYLISPVDLTMVPAVLLGLTEPEDATVTLTLTQGDRELAREVQTVRLLSYDAWSGTHIFPETTSAFVTPAHPYVAEIIKNASSVLRHWSRDAAFRGYAAKDPNASRTQMAAIYTAIQCEKIHAVEMTAPFSEDEHRIRLFERIRSKKEATALELAFLYAACLEAVGLHSILVFFERHCVVGTWLIDNYFSESIQDDASQLTKRTAEGIAEICLSDIDGLTSATMTFEEASASAEQRLSDTSSFEFALDIRRSRTSGIHPMPPRRIDAKGNVIFDFIPASAGKNALAPTDVSVSRKSKRAKPTEMTKQQIWERKLLDLSLRNTLLNFYFQRSATQILTVRPEELSDGLAAGNEYAIVGRPKEIEGLPREESGIFELKGAGGVVENVLRSEARQHRLRSYADAKSLASTLTSLARNAKTSLEESGANTLYLAFGFLRWYETDTSRRPRYAPLVLFPVELVRTSVQKDYLLRTREDEPQFNVTLIEHLRSVYGISLEGLDPLPTEGGRVSLLSVFTAVRRAIMKMPRWDVEEAVFLSNFSFANFIMYNDLRCRAEELKENKIVASLMAGHLTWTDTEEFLRPDQLDEKVSPADLATPLSADSSQLSAIYAAGIGKSFVLHGPPGTGKSQTITNMIANALYHGKSVLFIAEKMAALSVVQKRLESIGIAPFCLELHSNKAKKQDVLAQLDRTLQSARIRSPQEYTSEAERLRKLREQLNHTMQTIHKVRPFGFSLYDAIVQYERYKSAPDLKVFTEAQIAKMTPELARQSETLLGRLRAAADAAGGPSGNPFAIYRRREYSQGIKAQFADALRSLLASGTELQKNLVSLARLIPLRNLHTYQQIRAVSELTSILAEINMIPDGLTTNRNLPLYRDRILNICRSGQRRDELAEMLSMRFTDGVFNFDAATNLQRLKIAQAKNPLAGLLRRRKIYSRLSTFGRNAKPCRPKDTVKVLEQIIEYQECARTVRENSGTCEFVFGALWNRGRCDFHMLERVFSQASDIIRLVSEICTNPDNRSLVLVKLGALTDEGMFAERAELFRAVKASFAAFEDAEAALAELCAADLSLWRSQPGWLLRQRGIAEKCLSQLDTLRDWYAYLTVREEADQAGLGILCQALDTGKITTEELIPAFRRSLAYGCAVSVIDSDTSLATFSGTMIEQKIHEYSKANRTFEDLTKQELASLLSAKIPSAMTDASASSEIAILQRAIRSNGRALSIRKLFDSIPYLLRSLCPCMLMSPISVAQYIDPSFPKFDLVIFDEASQMPTCEAVSAIARGKELIVVGDPKQLPPTTFFMNVHANNENPEKEDLESILDDCLALAMPEEHLLWHYRSRHESLIAFCNRQYYENKLYTFPSPNDRVSRVRHVAVDGYYDRGKSKQNRAEATAVVSEIKRRLLDPELVKQSIGVVTFSSVQQLLIEDLLESEFAHDPRLEEAAHGMYEPIFVKNLENVQGDERDVIMFSVCYGPDRRGQVTMNFGPLNREGGWRRLNVAASRSRREMIVFSTLRPEQIDLNRTTAEGVIGLRSFLEFAMSGSPSLPARPGDATVGTGIAESVAEELTKLGYTCDINVGCSAYKIDIAIRDPLRKGEYLLGILCDGDDDRSAGTAHDRLILQDQILTSLGWRIYHLWSLDWWDSPAKELERIKAAAKEAALRPVLADTPIPEPVPTVFEVVSRASGAENVPRLPTYIPTALRDLPPDLSGIDAFCDPINKTRVVMQIDKILRTEAPISRSLLTKRLLSAWNIGRTTSRTEKTLEEALNFIDMQMTRSATKTFYWLSDPEKRPVGIRIPDKNDPRTRRDADDIPTEELACCVRHIVEQQYSLSTEDLMREMARTLGFSRCAPSMQPLFHDAIQYATKRKWVTERNGRITIV